MDMNEFEEQNQDEQGVTIYSKLSVLLFSVFFTPIAGAILLMLNLRSVGYKKQGTAVLLFGIIFRITSVIIISLFLKGIPKQLDRNTIINHPQFFIYPLIGDIIGGAILAEYFYKKYFPDDDYEYKSTWRAFLIVLTVSLLVSLLVGF